MMATTVWEWLSKLDDDVYQIAVIILAVALVGIAWAAAWAWRSVRRSEHRVRLTALLVERGYPRTEIELLLHAALGAHVDAGESAEAAADPEVQLVKALGEQSYDGNDTEKVLSAARIDGRIDPSTLAIVKTMAENWVGADEIVRVLESRQARLTRRSAPPAQTPNMIAPA